MSDRLPRICLSIRLTSGLISGFIWVLIRGFDQLFDPYFDEWFDQWFECKIFESSFHFSLSIVRLKHYF